MPMEPTEAFEKALSELYESLPHFFSETFCMEKKAGFPDLLPPNEEHLTEEIRENILLFQKRCHKGFAIILEELKKEKPASLDVTDLEKSCSMLSTLSCRPNHLLVPSSK